MIAMELCRSYMPPRLLRRQTWEGPLDFVTPGDNRAMAAAGLERFKTAQASPDAGFDVALREIRGGRKTGHWIWYVLPQLAGLGTSSMSRAFALRDAAEAGDYVNDPELGSRLLTIVTAVADQLATRPALSLAAIMGSEIDARKLVSSLTLFERAARELAPPSDRARQLADVARRVLDVAAREGYPLCEHTLAALRTQR
jgi:uncharacterized protein (DUF1810 family)